MGRLTTGVAAFALGVAAIAPVCASAQSLAKLHVRRFAIAADRTNVRAGERFHVIMTARVDEPVVELDNVTLPDLAGIEVSGDERRCTASARGSDCSETLTVAITVPGDRIVGPWTLDATDGRSGRPTRFSSNTIVVHVLGPSPLESVSALGTKLALAALVALAFLALIGGAFWLLLRTLARRAVPLPAPLSASPAPVATPPHSSLGDLIDALDREPTRARALAVREALRAQAGANANETVADLVARGAVRDAGSLAGLRAIERAAFCEDDGVARAAREAVSFLTK